MEVKVVVVPQQAGLGRGLARALGPEGGEGIDHDRLLPRWFIGLTIELDGASGAPTFVVGRKNDERGSASGRGHETE